jgi:hypothetical protein
MQVRRAGLFRESEPLMVLGADHIQVSGTSDLRTERLRRVSRSSVGAARKALQASRRSSYALAGTISSSPNDSSHCRGWRNGAAHLKAGASELRFAGGGNPTARVLQAGPPTNSEGSTTMPEREARSPDERLKLWAETLSYLAEPERSGQLINALNEGARPQVEALLEPTRIFEFGACIDVHKVLTAVINFGPGHWEDECEVIIRLPPHNPSQTTGKYYRLPNGQATWFSEAEWWEHYDRALNDPTWFAENIPLLKALGIVACTQKWVEDSKLVEIERSRTICFPTVTDPYG